MTSNTIAFIGKSVAAAAALAITIIGAIALFGGTPEVVASQYNDVYVIIHPSTAKAVSLALGFWGVVGSIVGCLLFGAACFAKDHGFVPNIESDKIITGLNITALAGGILIFLFSYLVPAYNVQRFTHKTLEVEVANEVADKDSLFSEKYQADPEHINAYKHPNEL